MNSCNYAKKKYLTIVDESKHTIITFYLFRLNDDTLIEITDKYNELKENIIEK